MQGDVAAALKETGMLLVVTLHLNFVIWRLPADQMSNCVVRFKPYSGDSYLKLMPAFQQWALVRRMGSFIVANLISEGLPCLVCRPGIHFLPVSSSFTMQKQNRNSFLVPLHSYQIREKRSACDITSPTPYFCENSSSWKSKGSPESRVITLNKEKASNWCCKRPAVCRPASFLYVLFTEVYCCF